MGQSSPCCVVAIFIPESAISIKLELLPIHAAACAGDAADYLPHSSYLSVSGEMMISAAVLANAVSNTKFKNI